ncbi:hypothetical protein Ct9H90mP29_17420 [bacterium]|nr:MAG: hypothetical protein Ct9H90mP29_17420 [bacterium]
MDLGHGIGLGSRMPLVGIVFGHMFFGFLAALSEGFSLGWLFLGFGQGLHPY